MKKRLVLSPAAECRHNLPGLYYPDELPGAPAVTQLPDGLFRLEIAPPGITPESVEPPPGAEAFSMKISMAGIALRSNTAEGMARGVAALLRQWRQSPEGLSPGEFRESPAIPLRGAMICLHQMHDFMPYIGWNAPALRHSFLDSLWEAGLNTLLVDYETMYPWNPPHDRIACADAYTPEDIAALNREAARRGITVIPLVQTLGHVYHILAHEEYRQCSELPDQWQQLCPRKQQTFDLVCELLDDVIDRHPDSPCIHLGGDECRLLGRCPECRKSAGDSPDGVYRLYTEYYGKVTNHVLSRGKIPILWHDIAIKHAGLLREFDSRVLFMFWNYGDHCHGSLEAEFGRLLEMIPRERVIGAPAARCEAAHGSLFHSMRLCMDNIERMNRVIRHTRCLGSILTDWPDSGIPFLLSGPLIQYQGEQSRGTEDRERFRIRFSGEYFGVDAPDFFDRIDAFYGEVPFAKGFQTELASYLNRYKFRDYVPQCQADAILEAMAQQRSLAEFYKQCHRRFLCRDAIESFRRRLSRATRHREELSAFIVSMETVEAFLSLSIGIMSAEWSFRKRLEVGYQLTPELAAGDLRHYLRQTSRLKRAWRRLYGPLCAKRHLDNYLGMLFKPELRRFAVRALKRLETDSRIGAFRAVTVPSREERMNREDSRELPSVPSKNGNWIDKYGAIKIIRPRYCPAEVERQKDKDKKAVYIK